MVQWATKALDEVRLQVWNDLRTACDDDAPLEDFMLARAIFKKREAIVRELVS